MIEQLSEFQYFNSITIYSVLNQTRYFSTLLCSLTLKITFYEKPIIYYLEDPELNIVSKFHPILNRFVAVGDANS